MVLKSKQTLVGYAHHLCANIALADMIMVNSSILSQIFHIYSWHIVFLSILAVFTYQNDVAEHYPVQPQY